MGNREVRCHTCGTLNRLPRRYPANQVPKCGRCGALLGPLPVLRIPSWLGARSLRGSIFRLYRARYPIGLALLVVVVGYFLWNPPTDPLRETPPPDLVSVDPCQSIAQPEQGVFGVYTTAPRLAPLEITTGAGANYFVKLENASSGLPVMTLFILGGRSLETEMPLGTFTLKYATGRFWCSESELFGAETSTSKADRDLIFYGDGIKYQGHTLILKLMPNGNFPVSRIKRENF